RDSSVIFFCPLPGFGAAVGSTLKWAPKYELAFTRPQVEYMGTKLVVHQGGLYYVYCQVGFRGNMAPITLDNQVLLWHDSSPVDNVLLSGTESVGGRTGVDFWYTSLGQGGLAQLESGHLLYVNVSHPELVDYRKGKTIFGLLMVS
ncbi:hypothetical protein FKM82_019891, partial [Ascaphus truei]